MKEKDTTLIYFRHNNFRDGQKEIITDILTAITEKKNILLHAPTGSGKTDAALSAAITFAKENDKKILFLTPKTSQHKIALEVVADINKKYTLNLRAIDFVGKRHLCIDPVVSQTGSNFYEVCKYAREKGQCPFFINARPTDKTKKELLVYDLSQAFLDNLVISHHSIKEISENFKTGAGKPFPLCPYEVAKIYAKKCNIIIADYYHVFSKKISDSLLGELGVNLSDCIIIIDEAHNLEERLLKLQSKSLNTIILNKAAKEAGDLKNNVLKTTLLSLADAIETIAENKLKDRDEEFIKANELILEYENHMLEIIDELEKTGLEYIEKTGEGRSALITVALFLNDWLIDTQTHIRFAKKENRIVSIKHNALAITEVTKSVFDSAYCSILMSATLTPTSMYQEIFGLGKNLITKEYPSPFSEKNRLDLLVPGVTTKYTTRNDNNYKIYGDYINKCVNSIPGNVVIFFPSFEVMRYILPNIKINKPKIIQEEGTDSKEFEDMITKFKHESRKFGSALFAVMGGKASEGIDLPGNFLIGAIIVGVPLGKMELFTKARIDYYEKKYNKGWAYAYIQPAIQKTIQSAGRVIRSETDRGVVIFLDERYTWPNYKTYLPKTLKFKITKTPEIDISEFFK